MCVSARDISSPRRIPWDDLSHQRKFEKTCDQTRKTGSIGVKGLYFKLQEVE